jgi:hypothetical protein
MRKSQLRIKLKYRLFELNEGLFSMLPEKITYTDYNTEVGREIVRLSRKFIGYSEKTVDCDIYYNISNLYKLYKRKQK